jgi:hypothetical protein
MNQSELIKEAVEIADKFNDTIFTNTEEMVRAVETLLDLANQYLDIKEPEEYGVYTRVSGEKLPDANSRDLQYQYGFNEALHLAKLSQMKKLDGLEDMLEKQNPNQPISVLAQAICQHMGGK